MKKPKLAVWKFASCDGCQLSLLDCEDELLAVAGAVDIAYFLEATSAVAKGPYDLSIVEGSITTAHDAERIRKVRAQSKFLSAWIPPAVAQAPIVISAFDLRRTSRIRSASCGVVIEPSTRETS